MPPARVTKLEVLPLTPAKLMLHAPKIFAPLTMRNWLELLLLPPVPSVIPFTLVIVVLFRITLLPEPGLPLPPICRPLAVPPKNQVLLLMIRELRALEAELPTVTAPTLVTVTLSNT